MTRQLRADLLLIENIRALLDGRGLEHGALAVWCGHKPPWISKILAGERGIQTVDLGRIADFFGLTVSELFQHGISPLTERRHAERRVGTDRRVILDRRQGDSQGRLHPDMSGTFRRRRPDEEEDAGSERAS